MMHCRKSFVLLLFVWIPLLAFTQEEGDNFQLLSAGTDARTAFVDLDGYKYQTALGVYSRLVKAKGDYRYPIPRLRVLRERAQGAWMSADDLEVGLEEAAYDVCVAMGPDSLNAMAYLLAHELEHYYQKHIWMRRFSRQYRDLEVGRALSLVSDRLSNETQADYLGGFLAYSAGFGQFDRIPELLNKLYEKYQLDHEANERYPSLQDRQTISTRSSSLMKELSRVFDMANYLTIIKEYEPAGPYFQYVLKEYQSREIYNNLGVASALMALTLFDETEIRFHYPLELDLSTSDQRSGFSDRLQRRKAYLEAAIRHFDYAISLDPEYAPAYLNKACVYAILKDFDRARFFADKEARDKASVDPDYSKTLVDIDVLMGILAAEEGAEAKARELFGKAVEKGSLSGKENLDILLGNIGSSPMAMLGLTPVEKIDGINLKVFSTSPKADAQLAISDDNLLFTHWPAEKEKGSEILMGQTESKVYYFHRTLPGYSGESSKGIRLGDSLEKVKAAYGDPASSLELTRGGLIRYDKPGMIFIFDQGNKLTQWVSFLIQE